MTNSTDSEIPDLTQVVDALVKLRNALWDLDLSVCTMAQCLLHKRLDDSPLWHLVVWRYALACQDGEHVESEIDQLTNYWG